MAAKLHKLTLTPDGAKRLLHAPGAFSLRRERWMSPKASLDVVVKRKSLPLPRIEP
jgi:hypothetical protein